MQDKDFIRKTWPFLFIAFLYIMTGLSLDKFYGSENLHLLLNSYHSTFADIFFTYYTKTGEFLFGLIIIIAIIKWLQYKDLLILLSSMVLQFCMVQGLKRGFFIHHLRPAYYFKEKGIDLHLVEGVKQGITFTFPSGHSATMFMFFLFLALITPQRWMQTLLAIAAVLGAYSRIYLSQHFMQDTIAGAIIGMFSVVLAYYLINFRPYPWLNQYIIQRK